MDTAVPDGNSKLRIAIETAGHDEVVVAVGGELDCESADRLRAAITALLNRGDVRAIGLDLRGLDFIDSTGIGTLVVAQRISAQVGVRFRLAAVSAFATRILGVLGVDVLLGLPPAGVGTATLVGTDLPTPSLPGGGDTSPHQLRCQRGAPPPGPWRAGAPCSAPAPMPSGRYWGVSTRCSYRREEFGWIAVGYGPSVTAGTAQQGGRHDW